MSETPFTMLYDGMCPICSREVRLLRRRAARRNIPLGFLDITAPDFDPSRYGLTARQVRERIHALTPQGEVIEGMAVFRRVYRALGLGWLIAWTGWPVFKPIADLGYRVFARVRPRLSRHRPCDDACGVDRASDDVAASPRSV